MPTVEVRFSPLPEHVRTARLLAVAVARRSHVDESLLDEVRLAVGEACSRAVRLHQRFAPGVPVAMLLTDDDGSLGGRRPRRGALRRGDERGRRAEPGRRPRPGEPGGRPAQPGRRAAPTACPPGVVLAVISGLVDTVTISPGPGRGTRVHMQWPAGRRRRRHRRPRPSASWSSTCRSDRPCSGRVVGSRLVLTAVRSGNMPRLPRRDTRGRSDDGVRPLTVVVGRPRRTYEEDPCCRPRALPRPAGSPPT